MPSRIDSLKNTITTSHRAQTYPLPLSSTQPPILRFSMFDFYPEKSKPRISPASFFSGADRHGISLSHSDSCVLNEALSCHAE
jgi:hypothetical protein